MNVCVCVIMSINVLVVSIVQIENNWMGARAGHPHPSYNQAIVVLTENLCLLVGLCV